MRRQNHFTLIAMPFLAAAMMITLGGCYYGGREYHRGYGDGPGYGDGGGYYPGNGEGGFHRDGMRSVPAVNHLAATVTAATVNAPTKVALMPRIRTANNTTGG